MSKVIGLISFLFKPYLKVFLELVNLRIRGAVNVSLAVLFKPGLFKLGLFKPGLLKLGLITLGLAGCLTNVGVERRSDFIRERDVEVSQLVSRGVAELQQGRDRAATESFEKALAISPKSAPIINNLVVALVRSEAFSDAAVRVAELEALEGESSKSAFIKGDIAYAAGDLEAAAKLYWRSVELISRDAAKQGGEVLGKERVGLSEEAKRSEVFKRLVEVKFKQGAGQEALALMQGADYKSLEQAGGDFSRATLYAKVALGTGRLQEAASVFESMLAAGNKDSDTIKLAAVCEYYLGSRLKFSQLIGSLVEAELLDEELIKALGERAGTDGAKLESDLLGGEVEDAPLETISRFLTQELRRVQESNSAVSNVDVVAEPSVDSQAVDSQVTGVATDGVGALEVRIEDFDRAAKTVVRYLVSSLPLSANIYLPPQAKTQFSSFMQKEKEAEIANLGE